MPRALYGEVRDGVVHPAESLSGLDGRSVLIVVLDAETIRPLAHAVTETPPPVLLRRPDPTEAADADRRASYLRKVRDHAYLLRVFSLLGLFAYAFVGLMTAVDALYPLTRGVFFPERLLGFVPIGCGALLAYLSLLASCRMARFEWYEAVRVGLLLGLLWPGPFLVPLVLPALVNMSRRPVRDEFRRRAVVRQGRSLFGLGELLGIG